jgi:hypothetical protein
LVGALCADLTAALHIVAQWAERRFAVQAGRPPFAAPTAGPPLEDPTVEQLTALPAVPTTAEPYTGEAPITEALGLRPVWQLAQRPVRQQPPHTTIIRLPITARILQPITARRLEAPARDWLVAKRSSQKRGIG